MAKFRVSLKHVEEAFGVNTTMYTGAIYINGVDVAHDGNTELGSDRGTELYWHVREGIEKMLGRELTEDEEALLEDDDYPIRPGKEFTIEIGDEPGEDRPNPPREAVEVSLTPGEVEALLTLLKTATVPAELESAMEKLRDAERRF